MKIIMIRPCKIIGGAEIYNFNLIEGFRKFYPNVELFFISTADEFTKRIRDLGAEAIQISVFNEEVGTKRSLLRLMVHFPSYLFGYLKTILKLRKTKKVNTLCFQSATEKIFLSPLFKVLGFRIIWIEHGPYFKFNIFKIIQRFYSISSLFADKIISASEYIQIDLQKNNIQKEKLEVVKTGISQNFLNQQKKTKGELLKKKLGIKLTEKIVGCVSTVTREKGIEKFVLTAKALIKIKKNIKFILVGDGSKFVWVKNYIKKYKLTEKLILAGFQKNIKPFVNIFNVFFFPTKHFEAISLSLMEAMAMEIPVITRDIGGNRELVIDGVTGYLFKDETTEELAKMILGLLNDPKKRREMGKAARERIVKYFNQERWIRELNSVFKEVSKEE